MNILWTKKFHNEDAQKIQNDLNSVYAWTRESNMLLNGDKFQLLRYGEDEELKSLTSYFDCNGKKIEETPRAKDLGIIMTSNGNFEEHINVTVQKAYDMMGWVLRTFITRDRKPMLTLYKSLILARLDYCSALWNPNGSAYLINKIEKVQRVFTRRVNGTEGMNYWDRLKHLRLYSVQRRRERYLIMYVFKIIHGLVPNCGLSFHENPRTGIHAIVPKLNPTSSSQVKSMRSNSFNFVAPTLFNLLPTTMRRVYDVRNPFDKFKSDLDTLLSDIPDEPTVNGLTRNVRSNSLIHQMTSNFV